MALSDFISSWWRSGGAFSETLDTGIDRANVRFIVPQDSRLYIQKWTRCQLNAKAEWLWQNFGIVKEGVAGIARHTVGKGISLQIDSDDPTWNELAEDDFESYALSPERCDLAGRRNFYETQVTAVEQRLIRGEFFAAMTENPEWNNEPAFLIYDSEEIATPPDKQGDQNIIDGIGLDDKTRAIAYYIRGRDDTYTEIPRAQMLHWFKPHAVNQSRGITDFAQAVNSLVDIHELKRITTRSAKAQQLIALVLKGVSKKRAKGAIGAIRNSGVNNDGTPDASTAQLEQLVGAAGAGIAYLDDTDGDAKLISPQSPTPLVEGFITDLLMRDACASWGVPSEFFWNMARLNGGNTRFILSRADLFFQVLGDRLIDRFCMPIAYRYLQARLQSGKLRKPTDPDWALKMSWQTPPRVTVDNERESNILIDRLSNGMITLREYCNARGQNYRNVMRQWVREPIEFLRIAEEEEAAPEYLQRLRENLPIWRAPKPGTIAAQPQQNAPALDANGDPIQP